MCTPPTPAQPEPYTEHFLVFMTLTEGRSKAELEVIADHLETLGACMDIAAEQAAARLTPPTPVGTR